MIPHSSRRATAALALSLALSLLPAFAQARPFTSMSGAARQGLEIRFADWVRSILGSLLNPVGAPTSAKNGSQLDPSGATTENGSQLDPHGATGENGPGLDPNGATGENGPGLDPDGASAPGENGSQLDPNGRT